MGRGGIIWTVVGILLIIALGLIPVFAQAIRNNETGSDYLQATNGNKSRLEESSSLSVNHQSLVLPIGATEGQVVESYAQGDRNQIGDAAEGWWSGAPVDKGQILWTRTTRVHVYSRVENSRAMLSSMPNACLTSSPVSARVSGCTLWMWATPSASSDCSIERSSGLSSRSVSLYVHTMRTRESAVCRARK